MNPALLLASYHRYSALDVDLINEPERRWRYEDTSESYKCGDDSATSWEASVYWSWE